MKRGDPRPAPGWAIIPVAIALTPLAASSPQRLPDNPELVSGNEPDEPAGSACNSDRQANGSPAAGRRLRPVRHRRRGRLAAVGDWVLSGALVGVELLVSGLIALAIRRPTAPPRHPGGPRLGTPPDPGNPGGRRPSR